MPSPVEPTIVTPTGLAANFYVQCFTKPKPSPSAPSNDDGINVAATAAASQSPAPTASPSGGFSPHFTYDDVVQQLNTANGDVAGEWSFAPYPACSRSQLLQVHAYWVAVPRCGGNGTAAETAGNLSEGVLTSASLQEVKGSATPRQPATHSCACSSATPPFVCVVGVVWVRLSSSTGRGAATPRSTSPAGLVEGYLQVVLTHPRYRRRGLATWLLRACLATTTAPPGVFAADRLEDGGRAPYRIERWHLHTLAAPSPQRTGTKKRSRDSDGDGATPQPQRGEESVSVAAATIAMYHRLGFEERRYLARYYAGQDDAVELMKTCV